MDYKDYDSKLTSMLDKIGNEASSLIIDDVATLLTDNQKMNDDIKNRDSEIERLKNLNSKLQQVNANLLLQVPTQKEDKKEEIKKEEHRYFNMREVFDENGKFKI